MTQTTRRELIGCISGGSIAAIAGCTSVLGEEPEYEAETEESLYFDAEDSDIDDLVRDDSINEHFDASYTNEDETVVVLTLIEIEESIEDAEARFEKAMESAPDTSEYDLADEAFWNIESDAAMTMFRDSNAVAQAVAARQSGLEVEADRQRSQQYAELLYESMTGE